MGGDGVYGNGYDIQGSPIWVQVVQEIRMPMRAVEDLILVEEIMQTVPVVDMDLQGEHGTDNIIQESHLRE